MVSLFLVQHFYCFVLSGKERDIENIRSAHAKTAVQPICYVPAYMFEEELPLRMRARSEQGRLPEHSDTVIEMP